MKTRPTIVAIIPALNEALAIGKVITGLQQVRENQHNFFDEIIVCDNGSTDDTARIAKDAGATVVHQPIKGYGIACLTAIEALPSNCDIVVFIDGDNSCDPFQAPQLCQIITKEHADLVIGNRYLAGREHKSMGQCQQLGNSLACSILSYLYKTNVTDLGPFRAIHRTALKQLNMQDKRFGWTAEMQTKALALGMTVQETPVTNHRRTGKSKISGTLSGIYYAGHDILTTIFKIWWQHRKTYKRIITATHSCQEN